jgi:hypothetical protein
MIETVIPAQAGISSTCTDSRLRGNDATNPAEVAGARAPALNSGRGNYFRISFAQVPSSLTVLTP